jgi:hypothetical protein
VYDLITERLFITTTDARLIHCQLATVTNSLLQARRVPAYDALPKHLTRVIKKLVPSFDKLPSTVAEFKAAAPSIAVTAKARPLGDPWWQVWKKL